MTWIDSLGARVEGWRREPALGPWDRHGEQLGQAAFRHPGHFFPPFIDDDDETQLRRRSRRLRKK
jgi:hypothetical protein